MFKKNCYHFTDKNAFTIIKNTLEFRITNKRYVKDVEDISYPEIILKECLKNFIYADCGENEYLRF